MKYIRLVFLLAASAVIASFCHAQTPGVTVNATLVDGQGNPQKAAYLHWELYNCGDNVPQVQGGVNYSVVASQFDMHANPQTGVISGSVFGSDQILCGGVTSTQWLVTQYKSSGQVSGTPQYYCLTSGQTFNPATAQPCIDPPPPPGFFVIFSNPIANQKITQPPGTSLTFNGTFPFRNGTFLGPVNFSQLSSLVGLANVIYVSDAAAGSSPCTGGGTGSFAFYQAGVWTCSLGGSGGLNNELVSFANALTVSQATSFTNTSLLTQCWDNNSPANQITPGNVAINSLTFVVTFSFATPQSGYCVVSGASGTGGGGGGGGGPLPGVFSATPSTTNFGNVALGSTSAPLTETLTNHSGVTVSSISIGTPTGTNAADFLRFNISSGCQSPLPNGSSCTFQVSFTPTLTTPEAALITITDSDSSSPQTVNLTGTGFGAAVSLSLSPVGLAFGSIAVNSEQAIPVTITNNGSITVTFLSFSITGTNTSQFSESNNCPSSLAPNGTCTATVTFTPSAIGAVSGASLSVASNAGGSPQLVPLSGTGIAAPSWTSLAITPASPTVNVPGTLQLTTTATPSAGATTNASGEVNYSVSGGGSTPWACVTGASANCGNNVSGYVTAFNTTASKTMVATNTSGNLLVVMVASYYGGGGGQTITVSDSDINSYSHVGPITATGGSRSNDLYYAKVGSTGSNTITCAVNSGSYFQCIAMELSGNASSSFFDVAASGVGTTNNMATASMTTTGSYDALVGFCSDSGATTGTMAAGSGYTILTQTSTLPSMSEYQLGLAAGNYTLSGMDTSSPAEWICIGAAFKGSGSTSFASINANGLLTALSAGTATVTGQGGKMVQKNSGTFSGCNVAPGCAVLFPGPQTSGNLNVVGISWPSASGSVTSVTDAAGNTYSAAGSIEQANGASSVLYLAPAIFPYSTPSGNTVNVLMSGSTTGLDIKIAEYPFSPASSVQDGSVVNTTGSSGPAAGSLTTVNANDEVICNVSPAAGQVSVVSAPFTLELMGAGGDALIDAPAFAAGAVASSSTLTGGGYAQQCVAVKVLAATDSVTVAAQAVTNVYYIAPSNATPPGNDNNPGTQGAPFQTFAKLMSTMKANCPGANGCTGYLENGIYNSTTAGSLLSINCGTGGNLLTGTSSAPITIQALNEGQAYIQGDGSGDPVSGANCSYVNLIGLHAKYGDFASGAGTGYVFYLTNWNHSVISRNTLDNPNRFVNSVGLGLVYGSSNNTVTENQVYEFHRIGMYAYSSSNSNEFARNYCNPRHVGDVAGTQHGSSGINACFQSYGSTLNVWENNFCENIGTSTLASTDTEVTNCNDVEPITASTNATNNSYLGDVCGGNSASEWINTCAVTASHGSGDANHNVPSGNAWTNFVGLAPAASVLFWSRSANATSCTNCSLFSVITGNTSAGAQADNNDCVNNVCAFGAVAMGMNLTNVQINGPLTNGAYVSEEDGTWSGTWNYVNAFDTSTPFTLGTGFTNTNSSTTNPAMNSCFLWVPASSPMHGTGLSGADKGADIEYGYSGGTLGATPLWSSSAACKLGQTDCVNVNFAIVAGLSDQAGASYYDVASRLNVNKNGCGYRTGFTPAP